MQKKIITCYSDNVFFNDAHYLHIHMNKRGILLKWHSYISEKILTCSSLVDNGDVTLWFIHLSSDLVLRWPLLVQSSNILPMFPINFQSYHENVGGEKIYYHAFGKTKAHFHQNLDDDYYKQWTISIYLWGFFSFVNRSIEILCKTSNIFRDV